MDRGFRLFTGERRIRKGRGGGSYAHAALALCERSHYDVCKGRAEAVKNLMAKLIKTYCGRCMILWLFSKPEACGKCGGETRKVGAAFVEVKRVER